MLYIPDSTEVAFPAGTQVGLVQAGECQIQVVGPFAGPGGQVRTRSTTRTAGQWCPAGLYKRTTGTDEWVLGGDLASA